MNGNAKEKINITHKKQISFVWNMLILSFSMFFNTYNIRTIRIAFLIIDCIGFNATISPKQLQLSWLLINRCK